MAEVAVGALAAEQVVSTGLEAGAAVAVARPTQPLKATLSQIATSHTDDASLAFARSHHTVTVIGDKAYIFGGEQAEGKLCSSDVHAVSTTPQASQNAEYACYPSFPLLDAQTGESYTPSPRSRHAAAARGKWLVVHGGADGHGTPINEPYLWLWDTESLKWTRIETVSQIGKTLSPRYDHRIFINEAQDILILHGGRTERRGSQTNETWLYNFDTLAWTQLPPATAPPVAAAFVNHTLYTVSQDSAMSGSVHTLDIQADATDREKPDALSWHTTTFPINPLTPGPRPREGGLLLPITTGVGRHYLVYGFGQRQGAGDADHPYHSDLWTLQLPSSGLSLAAAKDAIRDRLPGIESGELRWAEVEVVPTEQAEHEGQVHPGPRGFVGADAVDGRRLVIWGGTSGKGVEGDGWEVRIL